MPRLTFSLACEEDDPALRQLLRDNPMPGTIDISFRREPSYFLASRIQGTDASVFKAEVAQSGELAGLGGRFSFPGYLNGKPQRIGYLADLRLNPAYRSGIYLARAFAFLRALNTKNPLPVYTTMILQENQQALQVLTGARAGLPPYIYQGRVDTPMILLGWPKARLRVPGVTIRAGKPGDEEKVFALLNQEMPRRQFAPQYHAEELGKERLRDLQIEDFWIAEQDGEIIGTLAGWDQHRFRQIHVEGYHRHWRWLKPIYNALCQITPFAALPAVGQPLRCGYVSLIAIKDDRLAVFRALLRALYRSRSARAWHYLICAMHERDPLHPALAEYRQIPAGGLLFTVDFQEEYSPMQLDSRVPYIEAAAL